MTVREIIAGTEWRPSRAQGGPPPLISVLLHTSRGSGPFLTAARSVLGQELRDLELIVVDDGTTDGTAAQIRQLMADDERVSCLRHPRNVGLPAISQYEAYRKARAEHIAFAFDDDEFHPRALGELLREAVEGNRAVVHGYVDIYVREEGTGNAQKVGNFGRGRMTQALLRSHNYIAINAVVLHRRVLETVGLGDPHVCMARLCDWDLLRRIADRHAVKAVEVEVGKVWGQTSRPGHTRLTEPWLSLEWMNRDRGESLLPGCFEDYDVTALPEDLTREARQALGELVGQFRPFDLATPRVTTAMPEGRILVVTAGHDATTTLCFDRLPRPHRQRVRAIHYGVWYGGLPEEMVGASAVVFVRALFNFGEWIDAAVRLGVPHYYFLDDNLMLLKGEEAYAKEYASYTDDHVRRRLGSFSGVLLSSHPLLDYFAERRLHSRLLYYPPIAARLEDHEPWASGARAGARLGYLGGPHRAAALREEVLPAVAQLAGRVPLELVVMGMAPGALGSTPGVPVTYLPREVSYELALRQIGAKGIDILVHPGTDTLNNRYKTLNVLINADAIGAAPVLSAEKPYDQLVSGEQALLCGHDPASWAAAIERLARDPAERARLVAANARYCHEHFSGAENAAVIEGMLREHVAPGLLLKDVRFRRALTPYRVTGWSLPE